MCSTEIGHEVLLEVLLACINQIYFMIRSDYYTLTGQQRQNGTMLRCIVLKTILCENHR